MNDGGQVEIYQLSLKFQSELQQQKADPNYGVGINPISRLIQIMQAQKKKEPVYTLITERGLPRRREFIMQVMMLVVYIRVFFLSAIHTHTTSRGYCVVPYDDTFFQLN